MGTKTLWLTLKEVSHKSNVLNEWNGVIACLVSNGITPLQLKLFLKYICIFLGEKWLLKPHEIIKKDEKVTLKQFNLQKNTAIIQNTKWGEGVKVYRG